MCVGDKYVLDKYVQDKCVGDKYFDNMCVEDKWLMIIVFSTSGTGYVCEGYVC